MNPRRRIVLALGAGALTLPFISHAQQLPKVRRIGILVMGAPPKSLPAGALPPFMQAMHDLGYVEGRNLAVESRYAEGKIDRLPGLAAELAGSKVEVIVTSAAPPTRAAQQATSTIPIVFANLADPVGGGFARSFARPGGNLTGLSLNVIDVGPKQVEFLKLVIPKLSRIAFCASGPGHPSHKPVADAAQSVGVSITPVFVEKSAGIPGAFSTMKRERVEAAVFGVTSLFFEYRRQVADLALKLRIPTIFGFREHVAAGGLMSYGQNLDATWRRSADYVDKILRGAKPGELPIEQPTKFHLVVNHSTAKALGIKVPQSLLLRADEVIE